MTEERFNSLRLGLTSIARKVLDALPKDEEVSAQRVFNDLCRQGIRKDMSAIHGVLANLGRIGLIDEPQRGVFVLAKTSAKASRKASPEASKPQPTQEFFKITAPLAPSQEKAMPKPPPAPSAKSNSPFDELREMAINLLDASKQISAMALALDARLSEIEKQISEGREEMEKFSQLKSLLKSIG